MAKAIPFEDLQILTQSTLHEFEDWLKTTHESGGVLFIDKQQDWTSFDVVAKLRGIVKMKKIGHAGTLDPLATGLVIVCCGKATKSIDSFMGMQKVYTATIKLGATTKTDDAEAEEEPYGSYDGITQQHVESVIADEFLGEISQIPPMFSAIKKNGVPLYKLARKGKTIEREPRLVQVHSYTITDFSLPYISVKIECSKGTYIRSLARDLGNVLRCGAYLYSLRRTAIGNFSVEQALKIDEIQKQRDVLNSVNLL